MKPLLPVLLFSSAAALLVSAREARAQSVSVTGIVSPVQRCDAAGANCTPAVSSSDGGESSGAVLDAADCAQDASLQFTLSLSAANPSYNLQAWAGTQDCTALSARLPATATCWPVTPPLVATGTSFSMALKVRDIVSQATSSTHTVGYAVASDSVCRQETPPGGEPLNLFFFFSDSAGNAVGIAEAYPVSVNLSAGDAGPPSPDGGTESKSTGGGGCSMNGASPSDPTWAFAAALFIAAAASVRRRKLARAQLS